MRVEPTDLWKAPASLNRSIRNQAMRAHSAKVLATVARETGGDVKEQKLLMRHTPSDCITLRGIPAIGPGVAGVIWSTSPGHGMWRDDA